MSSIACLNGRFMPVDQCRISALDRGFIFGDAIYEVIPCYDGIGFAVPEHLQRMDDNLSRVNIPNPHKPEQWQTLVEDLIRKSGGGNRSIYIQVTRGVAARDHVGEQDMKPTVFAMATPLKPLEESLIRQGVAAVTLEDWRWARCDIKTTSLLANVLLRQQADRLGAQEAILIKDGFLTEGAASNVFVLFDGRLATPAVSRLILPGITRGIIIRLAKEHGPSVEEKPIPKARLYEAEEIWLSSSSREILPVTRLEGKKVGAGAPGPVWKKFKQRLSRLY